MAPELGLVIRSQSLASEGLLRDLLGHQIGHPKSVGPTQLPVTQGHLSYCAVTNAARLLLLRMPETAECKGWGRENGTILGPDG